jgi:two-component system nitrate/nitrite response regulator NarL
VFTAKGEPRPAREGAFAGSDSRKPSPESMIEVLIVSDVRLYRDGLAQMIARAEFVEVVGTAATAREGLEAVAAISPSVVLVNVAMRDGIPFARAIRTSDPAVKVVALAVPDDEQDVIAWAEAGAAGFVTAEQSLSDLVAAVEGAARGEVSCPPWLAGVLLRRVNALAQRAPREDRASTLTSREFEIAGLIERGLSNREIASELFIEVTTVKNHVHKILEKLSIHRRADVAARIQGEYLLRN